MHVALLFLSPVNSCKVSRLHITSSSRALSKNYLMLSKTELQKQDKCVAGKLRAVLGPLKMFFKEHLNFIPQTVWKVLWRWIKNQYIKLSYPLSLICKYFIRWVIFFLNSSKKSNRVLCWFFSKTFLKRTWKLKLGLHLFFSDPIQRCWFWCAGRVTFNSKLTSGDVHLLSSTSCFGPLDVLLQLE